MPTRNLFQCIIDKGMQLSPDRVACVCRYVMIAGDYPFGAGMVRGGGYHETVQKICSEEFVHKPLPASCSPELHDLLRVSQRHHSCVIGAHQSQLCGHIRHIWLQLIVPAECRGSHKVATQPTGQPARIWWHCG
jgi:hypothetical protein